MTFPTESDWAVAYAVNGPIPTCQAPILLPDDPAEVDVAWCHVPRGNNK
jgi:hypothetical protein